LDQDVLNVENELILIQKAEFWAQEKLRNAGVSITDEAIRSLMKDVTAKLRFLSLPRDDFALCSTTPLLSKTEQVAIYQYIEGTQNNVHATKLPPNLCPGKMPRRATFQRENIQ
jgi:hypothetical protein